MQLINRGCPPEVWKDVSRKLKLLSPLVSRFLDTLYVEFDPAPEEETLEAGINVSRQYSSARLYITGNYLMLEEGPRRAVVSHELVHILTDPMRKFALSLIDHYIPDAATTNFVREQWDKEEEKVVTDLSQVLSTFWDNL